MVLLWSMSRRVLLWNALISSALASFGLLLMILIGFNVITKKFTSDNYGRCGICRYQVLGRIPSYQWNAFFRNYAIILGALTIYAFASSETLLREETRLARSKGKRLTLLLRPFTGEVDLRVGRKRWGFWAIVFALVQASAHLQLVAIRSVEDKLPAGISHPLALLNDTVMYAEIGDDVPDTSIDPLKNGSLHLANPFIPYAQLYPNDTIDIPDNWANTSLYLPANNLPTLESHLYQSALAHFRKLGTWRSGTYGTVANLTHSRGGYPMGDAVYSRMITEGLGINMTTYEKFSGDGSAGLPREFELQAMFGESWVTNVSVSCRRFWGYHIRWEGSLEDDTPNDFAPDNQLAAATVKDSMIMTLELKQYRFRRPPENELQIFTDFDLMSVDDTLETTTPSGTERQQISAHISVQTIIIPDWAASRPMANSYKCSYMPSEFHKAFMAFSNEPIRDFYAIMNNDSVWQRTGQILTPAKSLSDELSGKCLSPIYALPAARAIHGLISQGESGSGGPLGLALQKLGVSKGQRRMNLEKFLESVLSETAQAYFSLLRQRVERANAWPTREQLLHPNKKVKLLFFKIRRLGGGSDFAGLGLCTLFLIFLATGTTFLRSCAAGILPLFSDSKYEIIRQTEMADEKVATKEKTGEDLTNSKECTQRLFK